MTVPRVALFGLATSHPYTDARVLRGLGCRVEVAEDAAGTDRPRLARFVDMHGGAPVTARALVASRPDLAIVTVPPADAVRTIQALLAAGIPTVANKPVVAQPAQLAALDRVVAATSVPFLTSSVLRFAPAFASLRDRVDASAILGVRATVHHDIGAYRDPARRWQDQPLVGGGNLFALGLHAVEVLSMLVGSPGEVAGAVSDRRHHDWTASEDTGVVAGRFGGVPACIEFVGASPAPHYEVAAHHPTGTTTAEVADGGDPDRDTGLVAMLEAALRMASDRQPPVRWAESREVLGFAMAMAGRPCVRPHAADAREAS